MGSSGWLRKYRNEYVRKLLTILFDKYFVSRPKLARAIGYYNTHIADFVRGDRNNLSDTTLDNIESYIFDLYEPLLKDELEINKIYFENLKLENDKERREMERSKWLMEKDYIIR